MWHDYALASCKLIYMVHNASTHQRIIVILLYYICYFKFNLLEIINNVLWSWRFYQYLTEWELLFGGTDLPAMMKCFSVSLASLWVLLALFSLRYATMEWIFCFPCYCFVDSEFHLCSPLCYTLDIVRICLIGNFCLFGGLNPDPINKVFCFFY